MAKKPFVGRGLNALLNDGEVIQTSGSSSINEISLSLIDANPNQPRTHFDEEALAELADSIRQIGVVQPITLRETGDGRYQIVAGERRFRASKQAGLDKIPAYVRTVDDETLMEMALVENIQREDLNAIEIALSYQRLMDDFKFTQEALSDKVGKKRATIANYVRLLKLPAEVQLGLKDKKIDMGHARALLSVDDAALMISLYEDVVANGWSVRKTEEMARIAANGGEDPSVAPQEKPAKSATQQASDYDGLCAKLSGMLGSSVAIQRNEKGKGKLTIAFSSDDEFEHILSLLDKVNA